MMAPRLPSWGFVYLCLTILLLQVFAGSGAAQVSDAVGTASLGGLTGFNVAVEDLDQQSQPEGLTTDQLRGVCEAQLKGAGIAIVPAAAWLDSAGSAQLYMEANILKSGTGQYSFALEISVIQKVTLQGKGGRQTLAVTWSSRSMGIAGPHGAAAAVKEQTGALIGRFIDGFRTANPPAKKE